ncbi:MAG: 3-isopropylmalate dehydratase small subunit, partial [Gammaproteobacteria bacterium]|nr:3-isopropylmalate dehydratase small subunit [Gammaproteobacteria bacterium]
LDHVEPGMDNIPRPINPDFVLNQKRYAGARILLARDNFGCGSSREHAPWALSDYGFRCIIAPSFADIFFNNCFKNGLLPIVLPGEMVDDLFDRVEKTPGFSLRVDLLEQRIVSVADGSVIPFEIDAFRKEALIQGLDDIGMTLAKADRIREYEERRQHEAPWLFSQA